MISTMFGRTSAAAASRGPPAIAISKQKQARGGIVIFGSLSYRAGQSLAISRRPPHKQQRKKFVRRRSACGGHLVLLLGTRDCSRRGTTFFQVSPDGTTTHRTTPHQPRLS